MLETKSYFDLCVDEKAVGLEKYKETLKTLYDFGYRTLAINQALDETDLDPKKKKKKGVPRESSDPVPIPIDLTIYNKYKQEMNFDDLTLLNRLTITFSNQEVLHKITKSPLYRKYDIIAVNPTSPVAFQYCTNGFEADILTFNPENKHNYKMNRKLYNLLVDRGYHFELLYSPAIEDATQRKNLIHTAHLYHAIGKSKNIIFSSGAWDRFVIRNPYDIISLGFIFGLNEIQSKEAISYFCRQLILKSVGRRHGKAVMFVENEDTVVNISTIEINDSDEDMETDQPAQKKSKQ